MRYIANPLKDKGLREGIPLASGTIRTDPAIAATLFSHCPAGDITPLVELPDLAGDIGVGTIHAKDERGRLGLGSFKALGAAYAIAKEAAGQGGERFEENYHSALSGRTYVCASAGNHGLSMAAGARLFGAEAIVYLSQNVAESFADRLRAKGATVKREGDTYEQSMMAAKMAAEQNGWVLLSDSSWCGYSEPALDVMEGYLVMGAQITRQIQSPPSHIFVQAGVGGLAAACTAAARHCWGDDPVICIVEPEFAPALMNSILAQKPVVASGPVSNMGRLDCKEPSHLALKYLAREADYFLTVSDDQAARAAALLARRNLLTTPSGAAGMAGLTVACEQGYVRKLGADSRILIYVTEGADSA